MHQLFATLHESFPDVFKGMSKHRFKRVYLKNLKEFKQIVIKISRDQELVEKLKTNPANRLGPTEKAVWLLTLCGSQSEKLQSNSGASLSKDHKAILQKVEMERAKSKDFWQGRSTEPHNWRAVLEAAGHKTSL